MRLGRPCFSRSVRRRARLGRCRVWGGEPQSHMSHEDRGLAGKAPRTMLDQAGGIRPRARALFFSDVERDVHETCARARADEARSGAGGSSANHSVQCSKPAAKAPFWGSRRGRASKKSLSQQIQSPSRVQPPRYCFFHSTQKGPSQVRLVVWETDSSQETNHTRTHKGWLMDTP